MAKAKVVPGDIGSREFDELRKTVHTILLLLETLTTANTADAAALLVNARIIGDAVANGVMVSGREVLGVLPKNKVHQQPQTSTSAVTLNPADKNY